MVGYCSILGVQLCYALNMDRRVSPLSNQNEPRRKRWVLCLCLAALVMALGGCPQAADPIPAPTPTPPVAGGVGQIDSTRYRVSAPYSGPGVINIDFALPSGQSDVYYVITNGSGGTLSFQSVGVSLALVPGSGGVEPLATGDSDFQPPAIRGLPDYWNQPLPEKVPGISSAGFGPSATVGATMKYYQFDLTKPSSDPGYRTLITADVVQLQSATKGGITTQLWRAGTPEIATERSQQLLDRFMNPSGADIYTAVVDVFGAPWGAHSYGNLISGSGWAIDILLAPIDTGGSATRLVGYFSAVNNFLSSGAGGQPDSNERLMFVLNSQLFNEQEGATWEITDNWPMEVVSTLAHEFQHMIHYYQRDVVRGASSSVWYNEMGSALAEEIVSPIIGARGPRGVVSTTADAGSAANQYGRMPLLNYSYTATRIDSWDGTQQNYSAVFGLGAYLIRNFGVRVVTEMLRAGPEFSDTTALTNALGRSNSVSVAFSEVVRRWGVAQLTSDDTSMPVPYASNRGGWFESAVTGGAIYKVGSINAYNYDLYSGGLLLQRGPRMYPTNALPTLLPNTNVFIPVGTGRTGRWQAALEVPDGVYVTVVAKKTN